MATGEKVTSVIVRITEDKTSAARVQQVINKTRENLKAMGEEAKRLPLPTVKREFEKTFNPAPVEKFNDKVKESREGLAGLGDEAGKTEKKVGALLSAFRQTQKAQLPTGNEMPEVDAVTGKRAFNLSRLGSDIKALPAVPIPGTSLSTDVAGKALNILGRTGAGLNDLALAGGIAAPAVAAVGLALAAYSATLAKVKADLEAASAAQRKYYEFVKTGDSKSAQARLEELRALMETENAIVGENANALKGSFDSTAQAYGDFGARILAAISPADDQLNEVTDKSLKKFREYEIEYTRLKQALEGGTFATQDAAKAEEELRKAREASTRGNIDRLISAQQEAAQLAATGTSESLKSRLEALALEKKVILDNLKAAEDLAAQSGDNSQVEKLRGRLNDIDTLTNTILFTSVDKTIAAREAEAKAAEAAKQKTDDLAKALDKVRDAQQKYADIQGTYSDKLADIGANLDKALTTKLETIDKAIADAQASRAELIAKADSQLNEEERKALLDREKLSRDHEKAIKKIMRDGARDSQQAIEDRDAVALSRAEQSQQDALDTENESYDERLLEIDQQLREQNRTVSLRLAEQLREVDNRLRQQTQAAITRYNEQVQVANQQTQAAQQAYQKQLSDLKASLTQDAAIRNSGYTSMLNSAKTFGTGLTAIGAQMVNQLAALKNQAAGMPTKTGGSKVPTPYAYGGNYRAGTLAQVQERYPGQREAFNGVPFPPGEGLFIGNRSGRISAAGGQNFTFAPVINSTSKTVIRQQVMTELDKVLEAM